MCRWRQVRNHYLRCGHAEILPPVEVHCESTACKFSPNHSATCDPTTCRSTHIFPEKYTPNIDGYCLACTCAMGRRYY
ncbi:hypothetical protein GGX14DRAFT_569085 [Mycena pura]|uniref:Uncharacterized protein n=1 Tax=Mycena pura TaxID=153505 RepID=A0AAD6Y707_9AGAR|nr:hypothetical protein GGX14DRAFT_569085 [Mycena pura]